VDVVLVRSAQRSEVFIYSCVAVELVLVVVRMNSAARCQQAANRGGVGPLIRDRTQRRNVTWCERIVVIGRAGDQEILGPISVDIVFASDANENIAAFAAVKFIIAISTDDQGRSIAGLEIVIAITAEDPRFLRQLV